RRIPEPSDARSPAAAGGSAAPESVSSVVCQRQTVKTLLRRRTCVGESSTGGTRAFHRLVAFVPHVGAARYISEDSRRQHARKQSQGVVRRCTTLARDHHLGRPASRLRRAWVLARKQQNRSHRSLRR